MIPSIKRKSLGHGLSVVDPAVHEETPIDVACETDDTARRSNKTYRIIHLSSEM